MYQATHPWSVRKHWHVVAAIFAILAVTTTFASYSDLSSTHNIHLLDSPTALVLFVLPLAGLVVWPLATTRISRGWNIAGFIFSLLAALALLFALALVTSIVNSSGDSLAQKYPDHPYLAEAMRSFVGGLFSFGMGFYCLIVVYLILTYSYFRGFRSFRRVVFTPPGS